MVSWQAVALHFADRSQGCVLLDTDGRIQMFSATLETLLGWPRERLQGQAWVDAVVQPSDMVAVQIRIDRALSGTLRAFECVVVTAKSSRFKLSLEASLVGRNDEQGLLLTVTSAEALDTLPLQDDVDYEITGSVSNFGQLLSIGSPGAPCHRAGEPNERCYSVIHGLDAPCPDCPALLAATDRRPRTVARRTSGAQDTYEVVTAEARGTRFRVRLRRIPEQALTAIYESKVRSLADTAQLSERERAVLTYLLMGRSLGDIATILSITTRTVKFHQSNVLEKLGADSRADLVRLVT